MEEAEVYIGNRLEREGKDTGITQTVHRGNRKETG